MAIQRVSETVLRQCRYSSVINDETRNHPKMSSYEEHISHGNPVIAHINQSYNRDDPGDLQRLTEMR